jgi:hypothetical protein
MPPGSDSIGATVAGAAVAVEAGLAPLPAMVEMTPALSTRRIRWLRAIGDEHAAQAVDGDRRSGRTAKALVAWAAVAQTAVRPCPRWW